MDELLTEFLTETNDGLAGLDRQFLELERNPENVEIIRQIFRVVHTIKGTCGFLGLDRLEKVAHATENVLGRMRENQLAVTPTVMGTLFAAVDRLKAIVAAVEIGQEERDPQEDVMVIQALNACLNMTTEENYQASQKEAIQESAIENHTQTIPTEETSANLEVDDHEKKDSIDITTHDASREESVGKADKKKTDSVKKNEPNVEGGIPVSRQFIRVHLDVLDNLITLISELVLTRNQLLQLTQISIDPIFNAPLSRLSYITTELQEEIMKTRMQTIENAWAKFPRIIHDLARELGKKIELVQIGGDTELDRQVLELIKDPLTHMIRNSADHGLETPDVRREAGKDETGTITLKAFHEGGQIIIEIIDDGAGIDPLKIRKKILEKGVATPDEVAALSDWQVINYIFKPGFSTASEVTSLSGRGVGMDVVKANIEKLSGTVDLQSVVGRGTHFTIKIPLTLTIISALIFESQGQRFAIPQLSVSELVRVSRHSAHQIEYVNKTPVLRLRNGLLSLIFLENLLNIKKDNDFDEYRELCVIVIHVGTLGFGIVVDKVYDTQEIVVKPLARVFSQSRYFSGSTILGDGGIVLIIDQNAVSNQLKEVSGAHQKQLQIQNYRLSNEKTLLLVFKVNHKMYAVPLALVTRIAEINKGCLECVNDTWLIHYQDHLLPVAKFDGTWSMEDILNNESQAMPLLIFADQGHAMGLAIEEIINIIETDLSIEIENKKEGQLGTTLINGQTTSIVDCEFYLKKAFPGWFDRCDLETQAGTRKIRVLLLDDSQFFRNLFMPLLTLAGYEVVTAHNGMQGLQHARYRQQDDIFDVIISDIEMPEMNGFDFAKELRFIPVYENIPLIALTSRTEESDIQRCFECGFTYHFSKNQQKLLIEKMNEIRSEILRREG